ncbi:hypothetical protein ABVK25_001160 [Lepraria finkii]|uniref:Borealin N-terminal domain-containing protein n=1 Tax=Lepraria finkii TaxID=1340010 RepID=A0ABR4BKU7_9LECA
MAPNRVKKTRNSTDNNAPARSQTVAVKSPTRTPEQSPQKMAMGISEGQKQTLIDNLQLEITERARKLRAQYALQAQSLRNRIELRINRIPTALRKANMGELFEKYVEMSEGKQKSAVEPTNAVETVREPVGPQKRIMISEDTELAVAPKSRGTKRKSDEMDHGDKENSLEPTRQIAKPKKRTKTTTANSRQVTNPSTVLSPKSANSRTLPQSPIRPVLGSPQKSYVSRPVSPLKPHSPVKPASPAKAAAAFATAALASMVSEKPKSGRLKAATGSKATNATMTAKGAGARGKRVAGALQVTEDLRKVSNTSNISSASSTGTTIVKNARKAAAAAKKNDAGVRATGKKAAAAVEAPPTGRRVLRKR